MLTFHQYISRKCHIFLKCKYSNTGKILHKVSHYTTLNKNCKDIGLLIDLYISLKTVKYHKQYVNQNNYF